MEPRIKSIDEELPSTDIQLCNLQLGPLIAKGSNSAVYSARLCSDQGGEYVAYFHKCSVWYYESQILVVKKIIMK